MPAARKVVGEAVALSRGHYPTPDGTRTVIYTAGEKFQLLEGLEKGSWFQRADKPLPPPPAPPVKERKVKPPPTPDDGEMA